MLAVVRTNQEPVDANGCIRRFWYPPLTPWQLYLLMVATCNLYAFLWVYRIAKDIRDHADPRVKPANYSVSLLFGIVAVFSSARLTWRVLSLRGGERRKYQNLPALVSLLVFLAYSFLIAAELAEAPALSIVSVLIFPLPWMLIQSRMNDFTSMLPGGDFRSPAFRFDRRQIVAMGLGLPIWLGVLLAAQLGVERHAGVQLTFNQKVAGSGGQYSIRIPSDEWHRVAPGTIGDASSDLELFGPSIDTWAIVYVHQNAALADVLAFRAKQIRRFGEVDFSEERRPRAEPDAGMSYVMYEAEDPFGRTWNWITTAALEQSVVELIVSARDPDKGNPSALARSLVISSLSQM